MSIQTQENITNAIYALLTAGATGAIVNAMTRPTGQFGINTMTAPDNTILPCVIIGAPEKITTEPVFSNCEDLGQFKVNIQCYDEVINGANAIENLHDSVISDLQNTTIAGAYASIDTTEGANREGAYLFSTVTLILRRC